MQKPLWGLFAFQVLIAVEKWFVLPMLRIVFIIHCDCLNKFLFKI
jgi:hypothetical protein